MFETKSVKLNFVHQSRSTLSACAVRRVSCDIKAELMLLCFLLQVLLYLVRLADARPRIQLYTGLLVVVQNKPFCMCSKVLLLFITLQLRSLCLLLQVLLYLVRLADVCGIDLAAAV